jgi:membrane-associated phospholipid phosphatase
MDAKAGHATQAADIAPVVASELSYGARFLRRHGVRLALVFAGVLVPLFGFGLLADELREDGGFFFDMPIMLVVHRLATVEVDAFFVGVSHVGYLWGVVPLNILVLAWLMWARRYRDGLFFGLGVGGSALLNLAAKGYFARMRPEVWLSVAPETSFSFPSGHAMGSASLAVALVLLAHGSRWQWLVAAGAALFVLLVGMARVYLGVHFPSDILAGWAAGAAWVFAMHQVVVHRAPAPPTTGAAPAQPDHITDAPGPTPTPAR